MAKKKAKPKSGDIVLVRWTDSCSPMSKWQDPEILDSYAPETCFSIGRLGKRDKKCLTLAASWSPDQVGDVTAIPASCIRSVEVLRRKV